MTNFNFNIFSNGLSTTLAAASPYDAAKIIADKLSIDRNLIAYTGDEIYSIGQHKFHIKLI